MYGRTVPATTNARARLSVQEVEGFTPQIGRYVAQLTEVRNDLKEQLVGLTQAQLDWHPDERTESIGTLMLPRPIAMQFNDSAARSIRVSNWILRTPLA